MKVLIAEKDHATRAALEGLLGSWGYEVVLAADGNDAWDVLRQREVPPLALIDWTMPGLDGAELCRRVRETNPPAVYVVALTARGDHAALLAALEAGADDFVPKPFDGPELRTRLRLAERVVALQESLADMQEMVKHEAAHDSLTGALNHATALDLLLRESERTAREGGSVSVLLVDLDGFRILMEAHGHRTGDTVLHDVASRLMDAVRPYDLVGRYGVHEFLVVLPRCGLSDAAAMAERVRGLVADRPVAAGELAVSVTASLGVATGGAGLDPDQLLRAADAALQRARTSGNRVEVAEPPEVALVEEP
jgi:two-component system cell cycle response regulator